MLNKLRDILNTYTDEELEDMELWVNSNCEVDKFIIDEHSIDLITDDLIIDLKEDTPIKYTLVDNEEIKEENNER